MSQGAYVTWIIERNVAKGRVRIGVIGGRIVAELAGKRLALANSDILTLADVANSRHMASLVAPLRDGGYAHLLGGQVGLLPGEAATLKEVARNTPDGLVVRRAKLVETLAKESDQPLDDSHVVDGRTGLTHHTDGREAAVSPTRQALIDFDRAHPKIRARTGGAA